MRTTLISILLSIAFISSASASFIDGHLLKAMSGAPVTDNAHLQFVGYVVGVIDADEQNTLCVNVPANALTPVLDTVIKYLSNHPEQLDSSGSYLVVQALVPKYSCELSPIN